MSYLVVSPGSFEASLALEASLRLSRPLPAARGLISSRPSRLSVARVILPCRCPCGIYAAVESAEGEVATGCNGKRAAVLPPENGVDEGLGSSRAILTARNEQELLSSVIKEVEKGSLPPNVASGFKELYSNYRDAVWQSGNPCASEIILSNMAALFDRILLDLEDPYSFLPYHEAIREPFDYYMFGQNYIRPLIDFRRSFVGNISIFSDVEEKLRQGHNVVLISNHQTEADPAIITLLIERTNSYIAESLIYVAGDRVLSDPLCKPFSMGRNLLCVYSKKHMYDIPDLVEMKKRVNTRALKEMALLLRNGSQVIWIAPSGGRDRPDLHTAELSPENFDASSVDNMRRLAEHSGVPCHIYPLTLLCYDIMPPPPELEKQVGERRKISFHGVGLSVAPEVHFKDTLSSCEDPDKDRKAYSLAIYSSVLQQYQVLKSAIYEHKGLNASNSLVTLSQPWFIQ